jgi:RNA-directed DNA polymerase
MKRMGLLFDRIADRRTLSIALHDAARGKHGRWEVRQWLQDSDRRLNHLAATLRDGSFRFEGYRTFQVRDTKTRTIQAPTFRDRVVHQAIIHATGPAFETGAYHHSYACRKGRGQHAAIFQALRWIRRESSFLKIDIEKFYDSVDHAMLQVMLQRRFSETRLLELWEQLLGSYSTQPYKGIPIGALTSQYLGNFYLDVVDRFAKQSQRIRYYLRYMDDMLFFGSHHELCSLRKMLLDFLSRIGLAGKHGGALNRCELGVPWLGFVLYPNRQRLNPPAKQRLRRKMNLLTKQWNQERIDPAEFQRRSESLVAHAAADRQAIRRSCQPAIHRLSREHDEPWPRSMNFSFE